MKSILKTTMFLFGSVVILLGSQSCNSVKPIDKTKLEGNWELKSLNGENATDAFKTSLPNMKFDFAENRVSGSGGCNSYTGSFTLTDKNEFTVPNPVATMKACLQENKEPQFFQALSTPNLTISLGNNDNELTLSKDRNIVLQFVKSDKAEQSIAGNVTVQQLAGSWVLTSISGGDINTLFADKKPTMEIAEDGKVFGHAGCNSYRTGYTLEGATLTFNPVASTKMACPSLKGEDLFTSLLATPLKVVTEGDKLSFFKDSELVLEFVKNNAVE